MVFKGCERSVITYSSLISACEKAGQSDLAMELFQEMAQEGCVPNTVTYNSLITACAQGKHFVSHYACDLHFPELPEAFNAGGCVTSLGAALQQGQRCAFATTLAPVSTCHSSRVSYFWRIIPSMGHANLGGACYQDTIRSHHHLRAKVSQHCWYLQ